ncbi:SIP domain-containing protein [Stutzerimonas kunmingensis]|uniref:SIP domain-containing protein n=1 Tax=Stutzerimonas kunmingensis TaxID=1211807 RepID=UPI00241DAFB9|nr:MULTISPECIES: SIP domain-containing protein [Stutzerimonas]
MYSRSTVTRYFPRYSPALSRLDLPDGEGFAWGAGEASAMTAARQVLLNEKQHPTSAMRVAAYWRKGASDFHEELTD